MKINLRLTLIVLVLVFIPLFFLMFLFYANFQKTLSTQILGQLDTIAQIQKHRAEDFLTTKSNLVEAITNDADLRSSVALYVEHPTPQNQQTLDATLLSIQGGGMGYQEVDVLDASGTVIGTTDPASIGLSEQTSTFFSVGVTQDNVSILFTTASGTGEYFVGPIISSGVLKGVLVIKSDIEALANLFEDKSGLGTTGGWALITRDPSGNILIVPQSSSTATTIAQLQTILNTGASSTPLLAALSGKEQDFDNIKNYKGVPVLAATRYIASANWGIAVTIHQDEAFAPIKNLLNILIFLIIMISIIVILMVISVARSITRPIIKLTEFADVVAEGNFVEKIEVHSGDEIGTLANALNQMSSQLRELYGNMEDKIKEKGDALEKGMADLKVAESEAERQSSLLRSLVDNLPVGILVAKAPTGEVIILNRTGANLLGRGIEENITKENYVERYHLTTADGIPYASEAFPVSLTLNTGRLEIKR